MQIRANDDAVESSSDECVTVELAVSAELLNTFHRRGRRRLYDLQEQCKCVISASRSRATLRVRGTLAAVCEVRRQLAMLEGPARTISGKVWCELMRTRTVMDAKRGAIAEMQEASQCRVHVERQRHEVRIFGESSGISVVERRLQELEELCAEEAVEVAPEAAVAKDLGGLKALAGRYGVTLLMEEDSIIVRGRTELVSEAVAQLQRHATEPEGSLTQEFGDGSEEACTETPEWWEKNPNGPGLLLSSQKGEPGQQAQTGYPEPKPGAQAEAKRIQAVAETPAAGESLARAAPGGAQGAFQARTCATCGCAPFCTQCGAMVRGRSIPGGGAGQGRTCGTCGCGAFCTQCGAMVQRNAAPPQPAIGNMNMNMNMFCVNPSESNGLQCGTAQPMFQSMPPNMHPNMMFQMMVPLDMMMCQMVMKPQEA